MSLRRKYRPKEVVRCVCGRVALRKRSIKVGGRWVGPECRKKVPA